MDDVSTSIDEGIDDCIDEGIDEGINEGIDQGIDEGIRRESRQWYLQLPGANLSADPGPPRRPGRQGPNGRRRTPLRRSIRGVSSL